jgi:hypothetical protein
MSLRVLALLALLNLLAGWAFLSGSGAGFPLDDAWGHLVYGRALATGDGFSYNPGQPEAGVTSPLWTALSALPAGFVEWTGQGWRPDWGMRLLGWLMGTLTAGVGYRIGTRAGPWPAIAVAVLLTCDPLMLATRYSGMEVPLFALFTLLFVEAMLEAQPRLGGWWAGLAVLTRPEGLVLAALGLILMRRGRHIGRFVIPVVLCAAPFAIWCQLTAGHPWPNTWGNKAVFTTETTALTATLGALARDTGWAWGLIIVLVAGTIALEGGRRLLARLLLLVSLALLAGVLLTREMPVGFGGERVPFYWERYALLAWAPLVVVIAGGVASVLRTAWAGIYCRPRAMAVMLAPLVGTLIFSHGLPAHALDVRTRFAAECADVEALNVAAGLWLDEHLPPDAVVATHDAFAVRYFGKRKTIDIYGNNAGELNRIIEQGGPDASMNAARYIALQEPDALACFPITWAAGHSPEFVELMANSTPAEQAVLVAQVSDFAGFLGLTKRAVTFSVPDPAVVDGPLHRDFAIFVRP